MTLSRIWSSFIIVAILVAAIRYISGEKEIFSSMVIGRSDDSYKTVYFSTNGDSSLSNKVIADYGRYGYTLADETNPAQVIIGRERKTGTTGYIAYGSIKDRIEKKADGILETCKTAVNICIGLIGIMALFMGLMRIAEVAGGIRLLSRIIGPFFTKLFPDIPKEHPSLGHMMMNFSANLLGLDNAATPFGLKAMQSLQELNPDKERASNAQIMFLCLHASGLTLIPVSIIAARSILNAASPTDIFVPCMVATFVATIASMLIVSFRQKINILQPVILIWILGISAVIAILVLFLNTLSTSGVQEFSGVLGNGILLLIIVAIVAGGWYKKINVFDSFIDGAKGGFETAIRIIPYLVGMLVAISLLRTSGTFGIVIQGMKYFFEAVGADTRFVDGLPTALIKPLSGSGARGMMVDTMTAFGPDSFAGRLSCILQGSSDTTFYVIAVYFGSVSVKNTRYAAGAMLLADLVGIITSILLCYLFFGYSG